VEDLRSLIYSDELKMTNPRPWACCKIPCDLESEAQDDEVRRRSWEPKSSESPCRKPMSIVIGARR
jgi:hypothetical protein